MTFETLQKDMVAAMKARDKVRKDAISVLVSAAKKVAIDEGCREDITEEEISNAMTIILNKDIFYPNGSTLVSLVGAKIVETGTTEFDLVL